MPSLAIAICLTLAFSFVCSLFEALVLSTTVAEVEALKKSSPRRGQLLETIKAELEETISAILTLNTIVNALGSVVVGAIGAHVFGDRVLVVITVAFGAVMLIGSEVLPKNLGVVYRRQLQPHLVYPLWWLRRILRPVTWLANSIVRLFVKPRQADRGSDEEILLLAERGARFGTLTKSESNIIANALSLDDVRVSELMTPRTVVTALRRAATVAEVFREHPNVPFGRMPVFGRNLDDIVGLARRRDLLKAKANDQDGALVETLMHEAQFIPETATAANALQHCLKSHQKLLIAVDEFGATAGVVTIEDLIEHLIGGEIFESDDIAVDMRELARAKNRRVARLRRSGEPEPSKPATGPRPPGAATRD
ncbi:MAG TPA: hemolysin family protein [Opitutaceae bacterium]|nr:hemolysin family protein [Opitutaceae bacterium]